MVIFKKTQETSEFLEVELGCDTNNNCDTALGNLVCYLIYCFQVQKRIQIDEFIMFIYITYFNMDNGSFHFAWESEERSSTFVNQFKNALLASDYTDVTLVTDDEKQVKAYKLVLGASSPFFQNIFQKNNRTKSSSLSSWSGL